MQCPSPKCPKDIRSILGIYLLFFVSLTFGKAHLGSLIESHGMPPLLQSRVSRGPSSSSIEEILSNSNLNGAKLYHLNPPSYQHSRLMQQASGIQQQEPLDETSLEQQTFPKSTFTPYISTRALGNMGKFFEHLRENIKHLQRDRESLGPPNWSMAGKSIEIGQPERRRESLFVADDISGPKAREEGSMSMRRWEPLSVDHWHKTRSLSGNGYPPTKSEVESSELIEDEDHSNLYLNHLRYSPSGSMDKWQNPRWLMSMGLGRK